MSTLTFEVPDEQAERLEAVARESGLPLDELLRKLTDEYLDRNESFGEATRYVLQKNAELYRRLAKNTTDELVSQITGDNRHPETDTGPDVGREV